jgi:hypothetical protein
VDEVEIQVLELQVGEGLLNGGQHVRWGVLGVPELEQERC